MTDTQPSRKNEICRDIAAMGVLGGECRPLVRPVLRVPMPPAWEVRGRMVVLRQALLPLLPLSRHFRPHLDRPAASSLAPERPPSLLPARRHEDREGPRPRGNAGRRCENRRHHALRPGGHRLRELGGIYPLHPGALVVSTGCSVVNRRGRGSRGSEPVACRCPKLDRNTMPADRRCVPTPLSSRPVTLPGSGSCVVQVCRELLHESSRGSGQRRKKQIR